MDMYDGLYFFIILFLALLPAVFLGVGKYRRDIYINILSIVFIYLLYRENPSEFKWLLVYCFYQWSLIVIYQFLREHFGRNERIYYLFLTWSLLPLIAAKMSGFTEYNFFVFTGISYISFRVLQIIIDSYDGLINESDLISTLSFLLFFPTITSGPIDRRKRFDEDYKSRLDKNEYVERLGNGIWKILQGVLYKFVLSEIAFNYLEQIEDRYKPLYLVVYAYIYGLYLFFDFAGYSLMAVGTSNCLGITVPDNFNKPFLSVDIKDFWDRWHITLSHWFRDFLFTRFVMRIMKKKWFKSRQAAASCGYVVNMMVMGFWHGITIDYITYGLYHGVLLALTDMYQKKSKFYKRNRGKRWYKFVSWLLTINLVMFGFLIFSGKFFEVCMNSN